MNELYECTQYGGFYTITGKNKKYYILAGTDEKLNTVTAYVPRDVFVRTYKRVGEK